MSQKTSVQIKTAQDKDICFVGDKLSSNIYKQIYLHVVCRIMVDVCVDLYMC